MTPFEMHTVAGQFNRVEAELAILRGMIRELIVMPTSAPNAPLTVEQPATEAPEPRAPQHFDGHHWRKGPSPEPSDADKPVGQG